jgi:hypothetical protein
MTQPATQPGKGPVDAVHRELGNPEYALEKKKKDGQEDNISPGPVKEQFIQPFGEQRLFQRIRFGDRMLHDLLDTTIALKDLVGLDARMIEVMDLFDLLYPGLESRAEIKMFVVDQE